LDNRALLLDLFSHALEAVEPGRLVGAFLDSPEGRALLETRESVHLFGSGKAAAAMGRAAAEALGKRLAGGVLIAPHQAETPGLTLLLGDHPVPTQRSLDAALAMKNALTGLAESSFFIYLLSGGSSALMELPAPGLTLADLHAANRAMLASALPIEAVNCIRKHLSGIKGGQLGHAIRAEGIVLLLSDVVGDDLETIGSAPLYCDRTTFAHALALIREFGLRLTPAALTHLEKGAAKEIPETPKHPNSRIPHYLVGRNKTALDAVAARARTLGLNSRIVTDRLTGEASAVAFRLIAEAKQLQPTLTAPALLLYGGETTVQLKGNGSGGRNQELALAAMIALEGHEGITLQAASTDGRDGSSDACGGVADAPLWHAAQSLGLDLHAYLDDNDSFHALQKLNALIQTGPTGTNVMDIVLILVQPTSP
jgi:hydroxypyruvate reductase/glycerate 2-kinase